MVKTLLNWQCRLNTFKHYCIYIIHFHSRNVFRAARWSTGGCTCWQQREVVLHNAANLPVQLLVALVRLLQQRTGTPSTLRVSWVTNSRSANGHGRRPVITVSWNNHTWVQVLQQPAEQIKCSSQCVSAGTDPPEAAALLPGIYILQQTFDLCGGKGNGLMFLLYL